MWESEGGTRARPIRQAPSAPPASRSSTPPPIVDCGRFAGKRTIGETRAGRRRHLPRRPRGPARRRPLARARARRAGRSRSSAVDAHIDGVRWEGELPGRRRWDLTRGRSRPGSTSSPAGATRSRRKVDAGQDDLGGELSRGRGPARARRRQGHGRRRPAPAEAAAQEHRPTDAPPRCAPDLVALVDGVSDRSRGDRTRAGAARSTSTARWPASAPGTSCSRARGAGSTGVAPPAPAPWPSSASTCSTCRRSTRSASPTARARNNALVRRARRPRQPVGHRRRRPAGHAAVHPDLGTIDDFDALVADARDARHRGRPRPRHPVLGRPPLAHRAPRVVLPPARRHPQVRREPAQEVPGHLQRRLRLRGLAGPVAGAARRGALLGRPRRAASSGSTTRTRSRSPSGSG